MHSQNPLFLMGGNLMKKKLLAAALGAAIGLSMTAASTDAHGVFFANRVDTKALVLGEGPWTMPTTPHVSSALMRTM